MTLEFPYKCPFCGGETYMVSEMRTAQGGWSAYFDVETAVFTVLTCGSCRHVTLFNMYVDEFRQKFAKKE